MSIWHLLILAVVVVLLFGTGKLRRLGPDLGAAIRGFKQNLKGDDDDRRREHVALPPADGQPSAGSAAKRR